MKIRYVRDPRLSEPYTFDNVDLTNGQVIEVPSEWLTYRSFDIKIKCGLFEVIEESPVVAPREEKAIEVKEESPKPKRRSRAKVKKEQTTLDLGE